MLFIVVRDLCIIKSSFGAGVCAVRRRQSPKFHDFPRISRRKMWKNKAETRDEAFTAKSLMYLLLFVVLNCEPAYVNNIPGDTGYGPLKPVLSDIFYCSAGAINKLTLTAEKTVFSAR